MANKNKTGWFKWVVLLLLVGGLVTGVKWYLKKKATTATEYLTAKVTQGDITQAVTATGQLNPVLNVQVGSQISGIIQKLYADFNTTVTNGQLIAELDPATYQANVSSAEGDLASAQASLELADFNTARAEQLFKDKLISESDCKQAQATLHQSQAQVKIRQAALERSRVDFGRCKIYSPVDGIVISRAVDVGQTVAASMSAPTLFVIANDLAKMQIDANVAEADVGGVEVGQDVEFSVDAFPLRIFHGAVIQVRNSPITVQNVVTYDTVIAVNNSDLKLKPGMTANVSIITARRQNVVKIPNAAFRFRPADAPPPTNTPAMMIATAAPPGGGEGRRSEGGRSEGMGNGGAGGSGGPGGGGRRRPGGGGGAGMRPRTERPATRTIYTLAAGSENAQPPAKPQATQIKVGISDGVSTEVLEGLTEGEVIVTGLAVPEVAPTTGQRPTNPFGGGGRRGF